MAKFRYRSGGQFSVGGITIRAPIGGIGHGGLYHSQSPEAFFSHCPGIKIVVPRGPKQAKGLLLASINDDNPVLFLEPKVFYRQLAEEVPDGDFTVSLSHADIMVPGTELTIVSWGPPLRMLSALVQSISPEVSCELIDLQTIIPWDISTVQKSVQKTGRLLIVHEAPNVSGFGVEISSRIQSSCFNYLKAPITIEAGWDTPFPLLHERIYLPNEKRCRQAIEHLLKFQRSS